MKQIALQETWPESWKYSYPYDLMEIYGQIDNRGYAYAYAERRKHTLELVRKVAQPGAGILDVAAAQGNFSLTLAELGYDVTWNDLRAELADYVALKHENGTIRYAPGNVFSLGLEAEYDVVLITEIIEHVAHPDEFLRQIRNLVKPGGYVIMSTPNGDYFRNDLPKFSDCADPSQYENTQFKPNADGHIFLIHPDEIAALALNAELTVLETRLFTNPLTNGHMKLEPLLKVLPRSCIQAIENTAAKSPWSWRRKFQIGMAVLFERPKELLA